MPIICNHIDCVCLRWGNLYSVLHLTTPLMLKIISLKNHIIPSARSASKLNKRPTRWTITGTKAKYKSAVQSTHPERIYSEYHFCSPNKNQELYQDPPQDADLDQALGQDLDQFAYLELDQFPHLQADQDLEPDIDLCLYGLWQTVLNIIFHHQIYHR